MNLSPLIFTDLDGSLLDHHTYSHQPARPLLEKMAGLGYPVIANTSKTRSELEVLCGEIGLETPFIAENGAGIYLPKNLFAREDGFFDAGEYWCRSFSRASGFWLDLLQKLDPDLQRFFTPLFSLSISRLCELTGLTQEQAGRAAQREFGAPVVWEGNKEQKEMFIQAVRSAGGAVLQGGRFLHVGDATNKGAALLWLTDLYVKLFPGKDFVTVALGDSHNDIDMLEAADYSVVIRSPAHQFPRLSKGENVYYSREYGPRGWVEGLETVFRQTGQI